MLPAEPTVLVHFQSVRVILFVLHGVVIALLALGTSQSDFYSHDGTSRFTEIFFASKLEVNEPPSPRKAVNPRYAQNRGRRTKTVF